MTAELAARRTAARAALADYRSEGGDLDMTGRAVWAERLASLLGLVLDELDQADPEGSESQVSETDQCPRCGGDCPMSRCRTCGGCENTGEQPCPDCQPESPGYDGCPDCGRGDCTGEDCDWGDDLDEEDW